MTTLQLVESNRGALHYRAATAAYSTTMPALRFLLTEQNAERSLVLNRSSWKYGELVAGVTVPRQHRVMYQLGAALALSPTTISQAFAAEVQESLHPQTVRCIVFQTMYVALQ